MVGFSYMYVNYPISPIDEKCRVIFFLNYYSLKTVCMLIEIKRNSHIKIRELNRLLTYMCMHGPNFNEMLETKENILSLTYIMKKNITPFSV
jgi:purine nucleoside phosphorylase